jgi:hypothetical protein
LDTKLVLTGHADMLPKKNAELRFITSTWQTNEVNTPHSLGATHHPCGNQPYLVLLPASVTQRRLSTTKKNGENKRL